MSILITLCARGGSKGIPGKNIKPVNNKPLIAYTIASAKQFAEKHNAKIALSTDDQQIKEVAAQYGLETEYIRPKNLADDTVGKIDVIADLLYYEEAMAKARYDYILDLDITSPLRTLQDLESALLMIEKDKNALNLLSVSPPQRNPYFNMVEQKEDGYFTLVKPPHKRIQARQSAPIVYDVNASFYFYKRAFFEQGCISAITDKLLVYEIPHLCFDLDEPHDFDYLAFLLENDKLNFTL